MWKVKLFILSNGSIECFLDARNHAGITTCWIWRGGREEKSSFLYQLTAKQALKEMVQLVTHNLNNTGKTWLCICMEYLSIPYWYFTEIFWSAQPATYRAHVHRPACSMLQLPLNNVFLNYGFLHWLWHGLKTLVLLWKQYLFFSVWNMRTETTVWNKTTTCSGFWNVNKSQCRHSS